MLSDDQIKKFQSIYKKRFGREVSKEETLEKGAKLLRLMELTYKPMTNDEYNKVQKRREELKT